MELTRGSYVILGMLAKGGHTGYEIKQLVDISTRYNIFHYINHG